MKEGFLRTIVLRINAKRLKIRDCWDGLNQKNSGKTSITTFLRSIPPLCPIQIFSPGQKLSHRLTNLIASGM
jgi:hypothetical protein